MAIAGILHQATGEELAALYEALGVTAVYNPELNQVRLGADPVASTACRGAHWTRATRPAPLSKAVATRSAAV